MITEPWWCPFSALSFSYGFLIPMQLSSQMFRGGSLTAAATFLNPPQAMGQVIILALVSIEVFCTILVILELGQSPNPNDLAH